MTLEETVRNLNSLGITYKVLESGTDGAVLALPEYGRILGLWPFWRAENAFWINPEFFRSLSMGVKETAWVNPGGDRMWLYPEAEFFGAEGTEVPHALDPGNFNAVMDAKGAYGMENRGDVWAGRSGARIGFRIIRRIRVYEEKELVRLWGKTYLRQAGYDEETSFEILDSPAAAGVWNTVELPSGGHAHLSLDTPLGGKAPAGGFDVRDGCAVVPCSGDGAARVWLGASAVKMRGAYVLDNAETGRSTLVLKEFEKAPADRYASEPSPDAGGAAGVSWGGRRSPSCGLSFRSPAAGGPGGRRKAAWKHSLWAFSGRMEEVREFLRRVTA